ncbi:PAS domain-containing protein [Duganella sp. FT135W]|uniref:histidine kinase n=1 Tax=Duganella flavida TaxID=2692175 RepID=A0A6L8K6S3_9BURK|nr:PAS domain-containing protein [Duganella flavida]MYM22665.1 PAS domain-containing protein [Duganella flavida]
MNSLCVLVVEDCESDASLILRILTKAGYAVLSARVETEAEFRAELTHRDWDLILSDYSLPGFSADAALNILRQSARDIPFIIISHNIGEEAAVAMMKSGAHDYVMKASMSRLVPAVEREIRDAATRKDRRRFSIALKESEARWNFALEGSGYGVWDWNIAEAKVIYSSCWLSMHGYQCIDMLGNFEHHKSLIHPDDINQVELAWDECITHRATRYRAEFRSKDHDGGWRWVLNRGMVVERGLDGKASRIISTHADISLQKKNEQLLVELNGDLERKICERTAELSAALDHLAESKKLAALGVLVTGIAHELNTPLGNIVLGISTLSDELETLSDQLDRGAISRGGLRSQLVQWRENAQMALRNSSRAADLIDRFKQIAVDQVSHAKRVVNLGEIIESCIDATLNLRSSVEIKCETEIDQSIQLMSAGHLEQVISAVLMNAMQHAFQGRTSGIVEVKAMRVDSEIFISIGDNGIGIKSDFCQRVFDPFFTTKLGQGSMGLGLTIAHNLVTGILKGTIGIANRQSGGVLVKIKFPCDPLNVIEDIY